MMRYSDQPQHSKHLPCLSSMQTFPYQLPNSGTLKNSLTALTLAKLCQGQTSEYGQLEASNDTNFAFFKFCKIYFAMEILKLKTYFPRKPSPRSRKNLSNNEWVQGDCLTFRLSLYNWGDLLASLSFKSPVWRFSKVADLRAGSLPFAFSLPRWGTKWEWWALPTFNNDRQIVTWTLPSSV